MPRESKHRRNIIEAAISLFRQQGYSGTGINDILARSAAPRGSLYYYFPQGKEEIGETAVAAAGKVVAATLAELAETAATPGEFIVGYTDILAGWMAQSGFTDGCPITTTLLETTPQSDSIAAAGREAFDTWRSLICSVLIRHGHGEGDAARDATLILAAIEGALILARVEQSAKPIHDVGARLARVCDAVSP